MALKRFMKRLTDILLSLILAIPVLILAIPIAFLIKLTSKGPVLIWSKRVGLQNKLFGMPKFRSMRIDTPQVATHLLTNPEQYITAVGKVLRKTSLDEIPQIYSVLVGDMSFVGPRPALFNQQDLIALRTQTNVHTLKPGITGWAQINGRDEITMPVKVSLDEYYLKNSGVFFDLKIIFLTGYKVLKKESISH